MRPLRPLATFLVGCLLAAGVPAQQPPLKAPTPAETEWHAKVLAAIGQALPAKFRGWDVTRPTPAPDATQVDACEGTTCAHHEHLHIAYSAPGLDADAGKAGADAANSIREDDVEYTRKLNVFLTKLYAKKSLDVDVYVNYAGSIEVPHCQGDPPAPLGAPAGWTVRYHGSALECMGEKETHDQGVAAMGDAPAFHVGTWCSPTCAATVVWTVDPASNAGFGVRNVVLKLRGSKAVASDFLKSLDPAPLSALLATKAP